MKRLFKLIAVALSAALLMTSAVSCGKKNSAGSQQTEDYSKYKKFVITLYPDIAPITCQNFQELVESGFYDGLTFHRVVDDFMAQGGDPEGNGTGGSDKTIKGEFSANGVDNTLSHTRGVVSMARSQAYDSASSQFFICYSDKDTFLDGQYAAFGKVSEGMDVVDSFLDVERTTGSDGAVSSPVKPIKIVKAAMAEKDKDGNPQVTFYMSIGE